MAKTFLIGIEPPELPWLRVLVALLRHPDPVVPELARQALVYLVDSAGDREPFRSDMRAGRPLAACTGDAPDRLS
jgi:hypothetical protein